MGGYERDPAPFTRERRGVRRRPRRLQRPAAAGGLGRGSRRSAANAQRAGAGDGRRRRSARWSTGRRAFTPDNEFCLGRDRGRRASSSRPASARTASPARAASARSWPSGSSTGDPEFDLWHMDVGRFGRGIPLAALHARADRRELRRRYYDIAYPGRQRQAGRPLRTSPVYAWHAAHGAVFGEKAGWERVELLRHERRRPRRRVACAPAGLGRAADWSPAIARRAPRRPATPAGLFDESSFAKIEVTRPPTPRPSWSGCATTGSRAGRRRHATPRRSTPAAASRRTSRSPGWRRRRFLDRHRHGVRQRTTWRGCAGRRARERRRRRHRRRHRRRASASRCGGRARATCWRASRRRTCPTPPSRS